MTNRSLMKDEGASFKLQQYVNLGYTDRKIQQQLEEEFHYKWSIPTIRRLRISLTGVKKTALKSTIDMKSKNETDSSPPLSVPPPGMPKSEQSQWFREDFKRSHLYPILKKQLSREEIDIYIEEYGRICCQFEDIVASEFFQIDDFLKHRIFITRQIIAMKTINQEIIEINNWLNNNPILDSWSMEQKKERVSIIQSLGDKRTALEKTNARYDKLSAEKEKMETKLNATRKSRLEQIAGGKETFTSLVSSIQHLSAERDRHGKYAELTRIAGQDSLESFRKPIEFPDGQIDTIITDSESVKTGED